MSLTVSAPLKYPPGSNLVDLDRTEAGFHSTLCDLALEMKWPEWNTHLMIFADWLEEHGRTADALMARADWSATWSKMDRTASKSVPFIVLFNVAVPVALPTDRRGIGRHNVRHLIGFSPASLKLKEATPGRMLQFSWCPPRRSFFKKALDDPFWPGGFPFLFTSRTPPLQHQYKTPEECNCDGSGHCNVCDGGLTICKLCWLFEGCLTTDCPGESSYPGHADAVYSGREDFVYGRWIESVSPHCPSAQRKEK